MEAYIGTILPWPVLIRGGAVPRGWAICDGSTLQINQYSAVYALLGTVYGGDGISTFKLPDLRGRTILGVNNESSAGPLYPLGQKGGNAAVTLTTANLPAHAHTATNTTSGNTSSFTIKAKNAAATTGTPSSNSYLAIPSSGGKAGWAYNDNTTVEADVDMPGGSLTVPPVTTTIGLTGNSAPVNVMPPYVAMNYIICLQGLFPDYD